jgi:hypothetical protein
MVEVYGPMVGVIAILDGVDLRGIKKGEKRVCTTWIARFI